MFWNVFVNSFGLTFVLINRKHEMFWNTNLEDVKKLVAKLTVNMKCFEIDKIITGDMNLVY